MAIAQNGNISGLTGISTNMTGNGNVTITVDSAYTVNGTGGDGIHAAGLDGNVTVTSKGIVTATATGISTASNNGTIIINGTANVTGGTNGISANSTGTGTVTINGTGNITGTGGTGILVTANGGDISIAQNGTITGQTGISASNTGTGNISIGVSSGSVLTATSANGVNANGVDGLVGVTNNGSIVAVGTGISATSNNGTLTIVNNGEISGYAGSIDTGIYALASGSGSISVTSLANIAAANYGINATSGSGAINVTIDPGITVTNNGAFGVKAVSNDDGNIFVKINGSNSFINASGNNSYGVYATTNGSNSTGNVIVSVLNGASISNSGTNGTAVYAVSSTNVTVNVLGNSSIQASGSNATAVYAYANGNVIINVDAGSSITAPSGSSYALQIANGTTTIYNLGVITGGLSLFGMNNAMTSSGLWIVYDGNGSSSIGAKYITNNGTLQTFMSVEGPPPTRIRFPLSGVRSPVGNPPSGAVTVTLNTTSDFNNNGLITMQDPNAVAGDQVLMPNANFTGGGASTLAVDSELGAPGSISDTLHIANAAGSTTINVVDAAPSTPGAYNPTGILVVDVTGNATPSNFNLQNGPINKGLFSYDLIFRPANGAQSDNQFLLVGSPGRSAFELSALGTAVQTEWYDTSEILLQRQEELRSQFMENNPVKNSASLSDIVRARQVGGVWAKLLGAAADRDQTQTYSIFNKSYNYNTGYRLQKGGIIGGVDGESIGTSGSSSALLFGLFGGTVSSSMHFKSSATRADFEGGTAGAYATYIKGNTFIDGLLRMDFQRLHYNAPSLTGWGNTDPSTPVFSLGGIVNAGYRMNFASTRYVEAFASLADVDTRIDPMTVSASTVSFGTQSNVSGRLGLRLGATFIPEDGTRIETFLAGGAWQRLSGANFVTINSDPSAPVLTIADKKVPTYGELSTGINIFGLNTGWSGFLKTNYKFSIGFNSGAINGGLAYKW